MFPWGAIIGLAGQAVSGALSTINNRRMQQEADAESARKQAFYGAKANENPLSRSENQHLLGQYDRAAQQQVETARNVAAITGRTPEYDAAVQKGVAAGRADLMGQMASDASQRADYYNTKGEQARHQKANEDMQRRLARNNTYAALAGNAASAVGSIMDSYSANPAKGGGTNLKNVGQSTSEKIASASSRAEQLQHGADAATSQVDKTALQTVANAAQNEQKIAASTAVNPTTDGFRVRENTSGFIPNPDGTYTKDGDIYFQDFDGTYRKQYGN